MAFTEEVRQLSLEFEQYYDGIVDGTVRDIVADWTRAWDRIAPQWEAVSLDLATQESWPSRPAILSDARVSLALEAVEKSLRARRDDGTRRINDDVGALVSAGARSEAAMIAASLPETGQPNVAEQRSRAPFERATTEQLNAITERTHGRVTTKMDEMPPSAYARLLQFLIGGISLGKNPREVAREILRGLEGAFLWGMSAATRIARTEMLDALRAAQAQQDKANAALLQGWRWTATMDLRTCPSCLVQDGKVFSIQTPGPDDHPNGRCARVPATRSWKDLGFPVDEPPDIFPSAQEWFSGLSHTDKLQIMGPGRLELLANGDIGWDDLSRFVANPEWRGSYGPTPVHLLKRKAIR